MFSQTSGVADAGEFPESKRWRIATWGAFLLLLGMFLFSHPGRIDMIDGQFRFEVSKNLTNFSGPMLDDYWLIQGALPTNPKTGQKFSYYTAPASLVAIPMIIISRVVNGTSAAADRFSFSLTSAVAGALIAPLLMASYRKLHVALVPALGCTLLFALGTLWWPGSETVFDQGEHGVAMLAMALCAYNATQKGRLGSAIGAGFLGGLLFNFRIPFVVVLPVIPVYWWAEGRRTSKSSGATNPALWPLVGLYSVGVGIGVAGYAYYNWVRFGQFGIPVFATAPLIGNPVSGFLTLAISPGKGFLWFSPPLILAIVGFPRFLKSHGGLAKMVIAISVLHMGAMSCLSFAGGDWCWGPRYLLPVMPLWALAFPFISPKFATRPILCVVATLGIGVQLLGLSLDHHRFFFDRRLPDNFWLSGSFYFHASQLASRPGEIWESFTQRDRVRPLINTNPYHDATYCPFGPPVQRSASKPVSKEQQKADLQNFADRFSKHQQTAPPKTVAAKPVAHAALPTVDSSIWEQQFKIFYLPRPWWGWINHVPPEQRPVNPRSFFLLCTVITGMGALMLGKAAAGKHSTQAMEPEGEPN